MPNHNAAVPSPELFDKENKVLELRRAGLTWQRIAEEVGYSDHTGAYAAYKRALKRTQQQPADELREAELDRIDRLQLALWPKAMKGDNASINTIVRLMERRARLLGLDKPIEIKQDVLVIDGGDLDEQVRRFAYLVAEARTLGYTNGEQTVLGIESTNEPDTAGIELADLVDPIGSGLGQDENGRGVDSLASPEQEENPLGSSSENLG